MLATLKQVAVDTGCTTSGFCTNLPGTGADSNNIQNLLQVVFGILAAVAVLMIVIASLNFINAEGDSQKVAKARNTIIYSLVGLVTAIIAEAIVTFVLRSI